MPAVHLVHLEEEGARRDENEGSKDPNRIDGVTEEFMVCLARAVKDAQTITVVAQNILSVTVC